MQLPKRSMKDNDDDDDDDDKRKASTQNTKILASGQSDVFL